jgi:hypothetical protein
VHNENKKPIQTVVHKTSGEEITWENYVQTILKNIFEKEDFVDACLTCKILLPFIIILYVIMQPSVCVYSLYSVIVPLLCEASIH